MRSIMRAIAAILRSMPKLAWNAAKKTWELSKDVAVTAVSVAEDVIEAPFRLVGLALGRGGSQQSEPGPEQAAQAAAQKAMAAERKADDQADLRQQINAMRRVASAKARGLALTPDVTEGCPEQYVSYIARLTAEEATIIARAPTRVLRTFALDADMSPDGVRPVSDVLRKAEPQAPTVIPKVVELRAQMMERLRSTVPAPAYAPR